MFPLKRLLFAIILIYGMSRGFTVHAATAQYDTSDMEAEGFRKEQSMYDGNRNTYTDCKEEGTITITNPEGIAGVYVEFDRVPSPWTLVNPATEEIIACGENAFLHEYVAIDGVFETLPETLVLKFSAGTVIADVYAFTVGELPDWVQVWQPPCEAADIMLLTTHSDDEQLFFAGLLPLYAGEKGVQVQVVYGVQHFEANGVANHQRPHEQLDGLWTVGVRNYPIMPEFPDLYAESKNRETALSQALKVYGAAGVAYEDFLEYITECLRRFKPLVVVSHDLNGEYGHGGHVVYAQVLTEAIHMAADETCFVESFDRYGIWETQKLYLHLYEENPLVMDYDVPLEAFGGKTAFEVTQDGFACHKSQHWTWFYKWIYGTADKPIKKATDIKSYSPCHFGLYYTQVGLDVQGGDFLENVITYEERRIIAEKEAEEKRLAELEAQRLAEEERKAEEARIKAEEERLEQEKKAAEEARRKEQAALEEELRQEKAKKRTLALIGIGGAAFLVIVIAVICRKKNRGE